jgi:hypothetical protein
MNFARQPWPYAQVLGKLSMDDHPSRYMPALKAGDIDQASLLHLGTYTGRAAAAPMVRGCWQE